MSTQVPLENEITFAQVFDLAQKLSPLDQARLALRLAPQVEWLLDHVEPMITKQASPVLRGLLADLGPAPSAEAIDEVQQEMWATFAQE
jgi:hypothetical protein